jgi:MoxR-like ATPase
MSDDAAQRLSQQVTAPLKAAFVGRDEVIDLIALAVVSGEHLFLYGPPGTAKSLLVRRFASGVNGRYFEYLLTRFSEPNELFGPVDLIKLREGTVATVVTGMLPEAEFAFLDELFNANSAILNNLLTVLNERIYRRGAETHRLPLLSAFAASNHLPEDDALQALFDRFLIRCKVDSLPRSELSALLAAGWTLERRHEDAAIGAGAPTASDLRELGRRVKDIELTGILETYVDAIGKIRDLGVAVSDRRAIKVLKLIAASAVLCGRTIADLTDLWVLRYVWDRAEQIGPLASLVAGLLERAPAQSQVHSQARLPEHVDPESLAAELDETEQALSAGPRLLELARLKERLTSLSDRAAWVADETARTHLLSRIAAIGVKVG